MPKLDLAQYAALHPHTLKLKQRERKLAAIRPAKRAEIWYRDQLLLVVADLQKAGEETLDRMKPVWPAAHDAAPGLAAIMAELSARFGNMEPIAERLAILAGYKNLGEVDERLSKAIVNALGVDISPVFTGDGPIVEALAAKVQANVDLIVSIPKQYLDGLADVVTKDFVQGMRFEHLAEKIKALGQSTDTRAWTIARDQTSKMNAAFNEVRQTSLRIEEYDWTGVGDIRERDSHLRMEGKRCRWDTKPVVDDEPVHPGEAILCRCAGIPVINLGSVSLGGGVEFKEAA